ncbi:unnamed protein product [Haemonchus placei]|uniref:Uncharacterized protein n=1 Tax=Haemonchus placei TaxID=6290 RepID=A0A0N4X0H2_HAEPC|nr:unnamed protein product [Haemonchus placei]
MGAIFGKHRPIRSYAFAYIHTMGVCLCEADGMGECYANFADVIWAGNDNDDDHRNATQYDIAEYDSLAELQEQSPMNFQ